jgi:hypothetical protein
MADTIMADTIMDITITITMEDGEAGVPTTILATIGEAVPTIHTTMTTITTTHTTITTIKPS